MLELENDSLLSGISSLFGKNVKNAPVPLLLPASYPQLHTSKKSPDSKIIPSLAVLDVLFEDS